MAVIGFHFSNVYEELIRRREKKRTILPGRWEIPIGYEAFVWIAKGDAATFVSKAN